MTKIRRTTEQRLADTRAKLAADEKALAHRKAMDRSEGYRWLNSACVALGKLLDDMSDTLHKDDLDHVRKARAVIGAEMNKITGAILLAPPKTETKA